MTSPHPSRALLLQALLATALAAQEAPALRAAIDGGREALAQKAGGLNLSAFADWGTWYDEEARKRFGFGAAELDLGLQVGERFEISGAWVKTKDEGLWAVYLLDWHPLGGSSVAPRGKLGVGEGFHIQVGRFDVPFGQDWAFYATKDSVSVSRPLTTDLVAEGGFNDRGLRLLGNNGTVNLNAYVLKGSGEGRRYGGRLGFTPFGVPYGLKEGRDPKRLEVGLSAYTQRDPGERETERALALDVELHVGAFTLLAEGLGRQRRPLEGPAWWHRGWHLTPQWTFGPQGLIAFARYEKVWGAAQAWEDTAPATRFAAGVSATLRGTLQTKVEFQRALSTPATLAEDPTLKGSRVLFQLVVVL